MASKKHREVIELMDSDSDSDYRKEETKPTLFVSRKKGNCNDLILIDSDEDDEEDFKSIATLLKCEKVETKHAVLEIEDYNEKISYHQDDSRLPIYQHLPFSFMMKQHEKEQSLLKTAEELYFSHPSFSKIASIPPRRVMDNVSFVIDTTKLKSVDDVLADDSGSWKNNGRHTFHYKCTPQQKLFKLSEDVTNADAILHRTYFNNKSCPEFRRIYSYVTDKNLNRLPLVKMEYQYHTVVKKFKILPHGNSKEGESSYRRTQASTIKALTSSKAAPRHTFDDVSEMVGGIDRFSSVGSLPRNIRQVNYFKHKDSQPDTITTQSTNHSSDQYINLMMMCKQQQSNAETQFIQSVTPAPQPIVFLGNNQQFAEVTKFCTNPLKFCPFELDPTFDHGDFSVTTTTYKHLFLVERKTGAPPSILGPVFIHQKKDKGTYKQFTEFLALKTDDEFRKLQFYGTDGEAALISAMEDTAPLAEHLRCFIHFRKNLIEKAKDVGLKPFEQSVILSEVFGNIEGGIFVEGLVDSEDDIFPVNLVSLGKTWVDRHAKKGIELFSWLEERANVIRRNMLKSIRARAGLPSSKLRYTTNAVESMNAKLRREVQGKRLNVCDFAEVVKKTVEAQQRQIGWAIPDKGLYKLHSSLHHLKIPDDIYAPLNEQERAVLNKNLMANDVIQIIEDPDSTLPYMEDQPRENAHLNAPQSASTFSQLSVLAEAAGIVQNNNWADMADNQDGAGPSSAPSDYPLNDLTSRTPIVLEIKFEDFVSKFSKQPLSLLKSMYDKAIRLRSSPTAMVDAPGCTKGSMMVESSSCKGRPHMVLRGKSPGLFKCDRLCANFNGLKMCSHVIAVADLKKELKSFFAKFNSSKEADLTKAVLTNMPVNPGKKGGQGSSRKRPKVPLVARARREYQHITNINPFFVKKMTRRITSCQGCPDSLLVDNEIPAPPYDYCIARIERRTFSDVLTGKKRLASPGDAHYHMKKSCLPNDFHLSFLQTDNAPAEHKDFVKNNL